MELRNNPPSLFIGSSPEGLKVAEYLQGALENDCEVTLWKQGIFGLGQSPLESIALACKRSDFAAFILTSSEADTEQDILKQAPSDNSLFEIGLFMGGLGRYRTFIVYCLDDELNLPTYLREVIPATFTKRADDNMAAAINPVVVKIREAIAKIRTNDNIQTSTQSMLQEFVMATNDVNELKNAHHLLHKLASPLDPLVNEFGLSKAWKEKLLSSETIEAIRLRWRVVLRTFMSIELFAQRIKQSEARSQFYPLIRLKNDIEASLNSSQPTGLYDLLLDLQVKYQGALDIIDQLMLEQFDRTDLIIKQISRSISNDPNQS